MAAKNKSNELLITRIYDAPVKLVWDAWTDPKKAAKWWGPRGFTITTHSKDLRVGGSWVYTMHGPDGTDWPNRTTYYEVEKYSRLVYDHGANETQPALFRVTVTFEEIKGKTKMVMIMSLPTPEAADETKKFVKKAGGNSTWDRLGEFLESESSGKEKFMINRSFEASQETLFKMWTDPEHVAKWLPPTGFNMEFHRAHIEPGGSTFYSMSNGQGMTMYGRAEYLEVRKFDRIKYIQQFCDENEKMARHPGAPTWPSHMLTTVDLTSEDNGNTRVTITWEVHGEATYAEIASFVKERGGMTQGWTGSFEKLDELLGTNSF